MSMSNKRWHVIAESNFSWEREALDFLRGKLPDRDPWNVWTNFEFIDDEGKINEVDALVLSPNGLFLIEIKSRPGAVGGDAHTWTWTTDGREYTYDNPLILANRKAKRLASLLRRQPAITKAKAGLPFVEALVFLSAPGLQCNLKGTAKTATLVRQANPPYDLGIIDALTQPRGLHDKPVRCPDTAQIRAIMHGMDQAGIRPSNKYRQVGDYTLGKLITEGKGYQDWHSHHVSVKSIERRIRIYTLASAASPEARASRVSHARREFEVLEGLNHPGILKVNDYKDTEMGPALVFEHDPGAQRLDHLLRDRGAQLTVTQRLQLVRDIAEILQYAHTKRLYHRALGPQSILIHSKETGATLIPQLMNWQTAARNAGNPDTQHRTTGTLHVEDYVEDPGLVYLAPETTHADASLSPGLDMFSLGALAYHIFSGQAPAPSALELTEKLRIGQGLRLSNVMDGCATHLQDLIQYATSPNVTRRYENIQEFLDVLTLVEDELTTPDPEITVDPSIAIHGDRLEGGFLVKKRVGRGASSDVLLVREDGGEEDLILKVARDLGNNDRLYSEGEVLAKLRHQNIVEYRRTLTVAGRTALLLSSAGPKTLAERIKDGRLALDLLQRFGEELIAVVVFLEDQGIAHRDIKPDNIGIRDASSRKLQLVVFDFSLCRTAAENINAGTPPYLDPFLALRKKPQWDVYAERFALAVTLYEMAIGKPPVWGDGGDGQTSPAMLDVEVSIVGDMFQPSMREGFCAFFSKALRREYTERFDNAEEMLRAWRAIFAGKTLDAAPAIGFEAIALTATATTTMAELGYSVPAQDVLEQIMKVHNARELLAVDRLKIRYLSGVGDKLRKEIRLVAKELARLRPDLIPGGNTRHDTEDEQPYAGPINIDQIAGQLLPRRPAAGGSPEDAALAQALSNYLGLNSPPDARAANPWPSLGEAAQAAGVERGALSGVLIKARERWLKNPAFTDIRLELDKLVQSQGQVMTANEAALALLTLHGCALTDDAQRLRLAGAVLRAAVEAESHRDDPRFESFEEQTPPLIARSAPWADYARQLGNIADACALAEPLYPPARALEALEAVKPRALRFSDAAGTTEGGSGTAWTGNGINNGIGNARLLRLATSASQKAALSSRQEIYRCGMSALQALRQSLGALLGARELTVKEVQERVRGRYPASSALPGRPELDGLLDAAGAQLEWHASAADGEGAYLCSALQDGASDSVAPSQSRQSTVSGAHGGTLFAEAQAVEERLQRSLKAGGLLVLTVEPRQAQHAESELLRRFAQADPAASATPTSPHIPLQRINFDQLLISALHAQASAAGIPDWNVVLRADAAEHGGRDWVKLQRLVQRTLATLTSTLLHNPAPILLTNLGLLARYDLMSLVGAMESCVGRPEHTPSLWMLLATHKQGLPMIDGVSVPLVNRSQTFSLPQTWIKNQHRATALAS